MLWYLGQRSLEFVCSSVLDSGIGCGGNIGSSYMLRCIMYRKVKRLDFQGALIDPAMVWDQWISMNMFQKTIADSLDTDS